MTEAPTTYATPKTTVRPFVSTLAAFLSVASSGDLPEPTYFTALGNPSIGRVTAHFKTIEDLRRWVSQADEVIESPEKSLFPWVAAVLRFGGIVVEVAYFPKDDAKGVQ